jgi:hypothetical protein
MSAPQIRRGSSSHATLNGFAELPPRAAAGRAAARPRRSAASLHLPQNYGAQRPVVGRELAYFGAYGRQRLAPHRETRRGGPREGSTRFGRLRARRAAAGAAPQGWPGRGTSAIAAIPASFSSPSGGESME